MKAKLVKHESKHESGYILFDEKGIVIGAEPNLLSSDGFSKLSFKNCQAIERGYDLDELATKICGNTIYDFEKHDFFRQGFQEALELMGDKKFSEEDVISMIEKSRETGLTAEYLILTKQQTEWDVEIEMECDGIETGLCDESCTCNMFPKLDADGCLILKRI